MPDHISRKELKHDKIKETLEHGAEAVYSHSQLTLAVLLVVLVAACRLRWLANLPRSQNRAS